MDILSLFNQPGNIELERPFIMNKLEEAYRTKGYSGFCLYGQRQVGKSFLLRTFIADKPAIYYQSTKQDESFAIDSLKLAADNFINAYVNESALHAKFKDLLAGCKTINDVLELIFALSTVKPMVFILDEIPYLLAAIPYLDGVLQSIIDVVRQNSRFNITFIICGSVLGVMNSVRNDSSPLFERLKSIPVPSFSFWESLPLLKGYSHEDAFKVYSVVGGYPGYLIDASKYDTFENFITRTLLRPYGDLRSSARDYLVSEGLKNYESQAIINAIASGATKENEIWQRSHLAVGEFREAFQALLNAEVVMKKTPKLSKLLSESKSYYIALPLFAFWSTFLRDAEDMPERVTIARESITDTGFSTYLGHCFEDVCRDYLLMQVGNLARVSGFWSDKVLSNASGVQRSIVEELDICIELSDTLLLGECKWQAKPVDKGIADTLIRRAGYVGSSLQKELYLFSKSGFTNYVIDLAEQNKSLHLVSFEDMFSSIEGSTSFFH